MDDSHFAPRPALQVLGKKEIGILVFLGLFQGRQNLFHHHRLVEPIAALAAIERLDLLTAIAAGSGCSPALAVAAAAMLLTLPVGVHLLFRAVHRAALDDVERAGCQEGELIARLNEAIAAGELRNQGGQPVDNPLDGGLIREDSTLLYPIVDGIPVLLVDEAIRPDSIE